VSFAATPSPPYWAVIFSSTQTDDEAGYAQTAEEMERLAKLQPGYLGIESAGDSAFGITVSYWASLEAISHWRAQADHAAAQAAGKARWYRAYRLRVAKVERASQFEQQGRGE
jgi:heme-degrading monooxygenase HmoA